MSDLLKLAEGIESGSFDTRSYLWDFTDKEGYVLGVKAFNGSLDAAKALHDAVLPGWVWTIDCIFPDMADVDLFPPECRPDLIVSGKAPTPAAAWVAAILRAKASEEGQ